MEDEEYEKALAYAEQLLLNPHATPHDMLRVYMQVLAARFELGEFYGAQVAGQLARQIALELQEWDHFGHICLHLGTAYDRLRQPEKALATYYEYLASIRLYDDALKYEGTVLFNIGIIHTTGNHSDEAFDMLRQAEDAANRAKNERQAHGIRHALIGACLQSGRLQDIPPLLAKCAAYLRRFPDAAEHHPSVLWHHVLRVRYAMDTGRMSRALKIAQRGLRLCETEPRYNHRFHMLVAGIHQNQGRMRLALEHGIQARAAAIAARRYDLEYDAGLYMYGLLAAHPETLDTDSHASSEEWVVLPLSKEEEV